MIFLRVSKRLWPVRLVVRTSGFHPENRGSIPLRAAYCTHRIKKIPFMGIFLLEKKDILKNFIPIILQLRKAKTPKLLEHFSG